jgi:hypothetical protein
MDKRALIHARLAEWGLTVDESDLEQLLPAYDNLLRWQAVLEGMVRSRKIGDGMSIPESEPITIHAIEKRGARS